MPTLKEELQTQVEEAAKTLEEKKKILSELYFYQDKTGAKQAVKEAEDALTEKKSAVVLDAAIKDGTAGRIAKDPEDQKRVTEFRRTQAENKKEFDAKKAVLQERKEGARNFQLQQILDEPSKGNMNQEAKSPHLGSRDDVKAEIRKKMESAMPYRGELGLFRKPKEKNPDFTLASTRNISKP